MEQHVLYIQDLLYAESLLSGGYPETLEELDLTGVDTTGITYTPIGDVAPYESYELQIEYSAGAQTVVPE